MTELSAQDAIFTLGLVRHPEGGWYAETFVDEGAEDTAGPFSTAIYYLLEAGDTSHWHRVDAVEVWHYYAGAPLALRISDGTSVDLQYSGAEPGRGACRPQVVVPRRRGKRQPVRGLLLWSAARWPGFQFFRVRDGG